MSLESLESVMQHGLLLGLLLVAAVHTRSRLAGAFAAGVWCLAAMAFGALAFQSRESMAFVGITVPPWIYFAFMAGLLLFNVAVLARALRRRVVAKRAPDTGRGPASS
jgi:hypothetical protein